MCTEHSYLGNVTVNGQCIDEAVAAVTGAQLQITPTRTATPAARELHQCNRIQARLLGRDATAEPREGIVGRRALETAGHSARAGLEAAILSDWMNGIGAATSCSDAGPAAERMLLRAAQYQLASAAPTGQFRRPQCRRQHPGPGYWNSGKATSSPPGPLRDLQSCSVALASARAHRRRAVRRM